MTNIFAQGSDQYAASRPLYPEALFDWIAHTCRGHDAAWDCATGNGQAALGLAPLFRRVDATDVSEEQVAQAFPAPNIRYSVAPAERTHFPVGSFDLIAVAQALHWLDLDLFWPEVRRVARPGALFCAWGYAWFRGFDEVQQNLLEPAAQLIAPYWAAKNGLLWRGYRPAELRFPFEPLSVPDLTMDVDWSTRELIAYVRTWSAFKRAAENGLAADLDRLTSAAEQRLGADTRHRLVVPLTVLAGFVR